MSRGLYQKKAFISRRKKASPVAELTPLLDMIFILLIFIIISASFIGPVMSLDLPAASTQSLKPEQPIQISIGAKGDVHLDNAQLASIEALEAALSKRLTSQSAVIFSGDAQIPYAQFIRIMDHLHQHGVTSISLEHQGK